MAHHLVLFKMRLRSLCIPEPSPVYTHGEKRFFVMQVADILARNNSRFQTHFNQ